MLISRAWHVDHLNASVVPVVISSPEPVVKFYALQITMAIGYLHTKGIMHRDLKLENILIDESGYLKIIDYGLAKTLPEDNLTRTFCGTPEYLAPEMVT